ncbi:hypothetical protein CVT25_000256 [Psilocybe cyanescens]|uniref:Uncharacterized protein n=1 Tax=Psilocybe cyanescens TaxID=93625 RepID=A0A409XM21_PSICY|nr:hypothetical protein CVT25_000256 [Psilocybe cyanescens]
MTLMMLTMRMLTKSSASISALRGGIPSPGTRGVRGLGDPATDDDADDADDADVDEVKCKYLWYVLLLLLGEVGGRNSPSTRIGIILVGGIKFGDTEPVLKQAGTFACAAAVVCICDI